MLRIRNLAVSLVLSYLRFWAHLALAIHRPTIIGIAGSVGKSSTKQILQAMIANQAPVASTYGNSETGVPLGVLGISAGHGALSWLLALLKCPFKILHTRGLKYLIVEMATDEPQPPKNMDHLLTIIQPDLAIHLNAQPVHTQQFAAVLTEEQQQLPANQQQPYIVRAIGFEDAKIITKTQANPAIINADDPVLMDIYLPLMAQQANRTLATFGQDGHNTLAYQNYSISADGTTFSYLLNKQLVTVELKGYILPQHFQQLIGAALLTISLLDLDPTASLTSLNQHLHLPPGRSSVLPGLNGAAIIDSTYNASTSAVLDMMKLLATLKQQTDRPAVVLLGDMRELGDQAGTEHAKVREAVKGVADHIYAVGPLTKQYIIDPLNQSDPKPEHIHWFTNALEAGNYLKDNLPANALVLAKGSQNTIYLEEAVKVLLANPQDAARLCRQDKMWQKIKSRYFAQQTPPKTTSDQPDSAN
jgi:UDP-N-acetylmuramoyl-tripeptide--D-alanyl-D-alanine ligase